MTLDPQLLAILACPKCKKPLEYREADQALDCANCRVRYAIRDGIPVLLIEEATPLR
jgi:uncharacterized protein YbaR (Trm112 family)